jgi:hypothetical protein
MIPNLPIYISVIFGLTTVATLGLFIWAIKNSALQTVRRKTTAIIFGLIIWLTIQAVLALKNIYTQDTNSFPPKIMILGILPAILAIIVLFITAKGRRFIDSLPLKNLTYLNVVRVPVEIVLYWLFLNKTIPQLMTFEGRNFDIIAGITAPLIAYFGLTKPLLNLRIVLLWNFICLGLLLNIVINALLAAPSPIQQFAFTQPNIAILYFPFSWLPAFIVPVVLFTHLVSIKKMIKQVNLAAK